MESTSDIILLTLLNFAMTFLIVLQFCIFLAVILSWFPNARGHPVTQFVRRIAEPILAVFRQFIPRVGMIDISPIAAFITIEIIYRLLSNIAATLA